MPERNAPRDSGLSSPHQEVDGTATRGDDKATPSKRRLRARLSRRYVEIGVPVPALLLERGRWQIRVEPDCWRRERYNYPPAWRFLPAVDGVVAPIMRCWSLGPIHVYRHRWL